MSKEYRKAMGFTRKDEFQKYLSAKDIKEPNWILIQKQNSRLDNIFTKINQQLSIPYQGNISQDIIDTFMQIKNNNILPRMRNNGRAMEDVYYSWMLGYMAEKVFTPFIIDKLILGKLERSGGDDLTSIDTFKRTGDADLIDKTADVRIDVQCGTGGGVSTIKKHKVDQAVKVGGTTYAALFGLMTGTYAFIKLNDLNESKDVHFYANPSWENQLCWDVPENTFKNWYA
jgi:hypothetical protein